MKTIISSTYKWFSTVLLFIFPFFCISQNLVPNPSFEEYWSCPYNQCQINKAKYWYSIGETPDYFNTCAFDASFSIPQNSVGYQIAFTGNAYVGIYNDIGVCGTTSREYIGCELTDSLKPGIQYFISFKISLADRSNYSINKMGALFSMQDYKIIPYYCIAHNGGTLYPNNNPHIYSSQIIIDTSEWYTIEGSFIPQLPYKYLIIGNFFENNQIQYIIVNTNTNVWGSYYYIDDVYVCDKPLSFSINKKNKSSVEIVPNPTTGMIKVLFENPFNDNYILQIYSIFGGTIYEQALQNQPMQQIDLSHLADGMYYARVFNRERSWVEKVVIQR